MITISDDFTSPGEAFILYCITVHSNPPNTAVNAPSWLAQRSRNKLKVRPPQREGRNRRERPHKNRIRSLQTGWDPSSRTENRGDRTEEIFGM